MVQFLEMSPEIHHLVFAHLLTQRDTLHLILTCQFLSSIGLPYLVSNFTILLNCDDGTHVANMCRYLLSRKDSMSNGETNIRFRLEDLKSLQITSHPADHIDLDDDPEEVEDDYDDNNDDHDNRSDHDNTEGNTDLLTPDSKDQSSVELILQLLLHSVTKLRLKQLTIDERILSLDSRFIEYIGSLSALCSLSITSMDELEDVFTYTLLDQLQTSNLKRLYINTVFGDISLFSLLHSLSNHTHSLEVLEVPCFHCQNPPTDSTHGCNSIDLVFPQLHTLFLCFVDFSQLLEIQSFQRIFPNLKIFKFRILYYLRGLPGDEILSFADSIRAQNLASFREHASWKLEKVEGDCLSLYASGIGCGGEKQVVYVRIHQEIGYGVTWPDPRKRTQREMKSHEIWSTVLHDTVPECLDIENDIVTYEGFIDRLGSLLVDSQAVKENGYHGVRRLVMRLNPKPRTVQTMTKDEVKNLIIDIEPCIQQAFSRVDSLKSLHIIVDPRLESDRFRYIHYSYHDMPILQKVLRGIPSLERISLSSSSLVA
ncbi:hypothetical protein ABKN59_009577 [Abortiporus biennis]